MKKATIWVLSVLASVALFLVIVFTCFQLVAFDEGRYTKAQQQYNLMEVTGMDQTTLQKVTHELLLYCQGRRDTLDMQAPINGQVREVFDEREKSHMVDVQLLFLAGYKLRAMAIAAFFLVVLLLTAVHRGQTARALARGWLATIAVLGVLMAALGIAMAIDFTGVFTRFHLLFFSNDLWLLDPTYEVLIQMLPEAFFLSIAKAIVLWSAGGLAVVTAGAAALLIRARRKDRRAAAHG